MSQLVGAALPARAFVRDLIALTNPRIVSRLAAAMVVDRVHGI